MVEYKHPLEINQGQLCIPAILTKLWCFLKEMEDILRLYFIEMQASGKNHVELIIPAFDERRTRIYLRIVPENHEAPPSAIRESTLNHDQWQKQHSMGPWFSSVDKDLWEKRESYINFQLAILQTFLAKEVGGLCTGSETTTQVQIKDENAETGNVGAWDQHEEGMKVERYPTIEQQTDTEQQMSFQFSLGCEQTTGNVGTWDQQAKYAPYNIAAPVHDFRYGPTNTSQFPFMGEVLPWPPQNQEDEPFSFVTDYSPEIT